MSDYEVEIAGGVREPTAEWTFIVDDAVHGLGRLVDGTRTIPVIVEGAGSAWHVTLRGRRIPVAVRSWRERLAAAAETAARVHAGPVVVKATLPGLIVAVAVEEGSVVDEGTTLLTIEAMKMQNEVRAPRAGTVVEVAVASGQTVATGAPLVRIDEAQDRSLHGGTEHGRSGGDDDVDDDRHAESEEGDLRTGGQAEPMSDEPERRDRAE